jgi:hypothetical protein
MAYWKLLGDADCIDGEASIPGTSGQGERLLLSEPKYEYLKVYVGDRHRTFKLKVRESGRGSTIFVSIGALGAGAQEVDCEVEFQTAEVFRRQQLLRTSGGRVAILGLVVGVLGMVIDLIVKAFAPEGSALFQYKAGLYVLAFLVQATGFWILFRKAYRKAEY